MKHSFPQIKSAAEQQRLDALADSLDALARMVRQVGTANDRSEPIYTGVLRNRLPDAAMALAVLQAEFGEQGAPSVEAEMQTEPMLRLTTPAEDRTILIEATERGYRAKLPYKPCDSAIRGFHQAKMVWQKNGGSSLDVYWTIPADKLEFAKEIIGYWFTESPSGDGLNRQGKACYRVMAKPNTETLVGQLREADRTFADDDAARWDFKSDIVSDFCGQMAA